MFHKKALFILSLLSCFSIVAGSLHAKSKTPGEKVDQAIESTKEKSHKTKDYLKEKAKDTKKYLKGKAKDLKKEYNDARDNVGEKIKHTKS